MPENEAQRLRESIRILESENSKLKSERREVEMAGIRDLKSGQDQIYEKIHGVQQTVTALSTQLGTITENQAQVKRVLFGNEPEDSLLFRIRQIERERHNERKAEKEAAVEAAMEKARVKKWCWALVATALAGLIKHTWDSVFGHNH